MTSTAYGIDTDENVAISGMQKLECNKNVAISGMQKLECNENVANSGSKWIKSWSKLNKNQMDTNVTKM